VTCVMPSTSQSVEKRYTVHLDPASSSSRWVADSSGVVIGGCFLEMRRCPGRDQAVLRPGRTVSGVACGL
jgi:hypothetical protein